MESDEPLIYRVGTFFYVIGGGAFVLFVVSDFAEQAEFDFLFMALVMIAIGWMFRRGKPPPPSAERFAWWRKTREEAKKKKQGKQEAKKR
jgi:flagellar biosynthesis component FlhA